MELASREVLEEGGERWLLIDNYMDNMIEELPEVPEEEVKMTPIVTAVTSTASYSDSTYVPTIVTATLFLLGLNMAYMFRALVSTPSGASTFFVVCLNALGAWSILNAASKSFLVPRRAVENDDEKHEDLIAPEIPAPPETKHDDEEEEKDEATPKGTSTLPSRIIPVLRGRVTEDATRAVVHQKMVITTRDLVTARALLRKISKIQNTD